MGGESTVCLKVVADVQSARLCTHSTIGSLLIFYAWAQASQSLRLPTSKCERDKRDSSRCTQARLTV